MVKFETVMESILMIGIFGGSLYLLNTLGDERAERNQTEIKKCTDLGGLPITSAWGGRLSNCIIKETKQCQCTQ